MEIRFYQYGHGSGWGKVIMSTGNRNIQRYPEFPRIVPETVLAAWGDIGRWASSFIRSLEEKEALNIFNVQIDQNRSINIEGRIKVGDTAASVTAQAGDIRFNSTTNKHQGYNGSGWNDLY